MKLFWTTGFLALVACSLQAAELKIGTLDLQRLLKEYYRAEETAKTLEARQKTMFKELAELRLDGNRLLREAQDLQNRSLDPALNHDARREAKKNFESRLADLRAFEVKYDQTKLEKEQEFQNEMGLANKRIFGEILTTTRGICEKEGFNLVLNASKANPTSSEVLFSKNVEDITEKVLLSLNAAKPRESSPAPPQPK